MKKKMRQIFLCLLGTAGSAHCSDALHTGLAVGRSGTDRRGVAAGNLGVTDQSTVARAGGAMFERRALGVGSARGRVSTGRDALVGYTGVARWTIGIGATAVAAHSR